MAFETFPSQPCPTTPAVKTSLPDTESVQLGRGYREDIVLSPYAFKVFELRWANQRPAKIDPLERFLVRHYGSRTFRWTDPDGQTGLYRCRRWRVALNQGIYTLSATFEEVNY